MGGENVKIKKEKISPAEVETNPIVTKIKVSILWLSIREGSEQLLII